MRESRGRSVIASNYNRAGAPAAFELTRRETQVLQWVATGKTNTEIGGILGVSPRTVQKHLEHIFRKLGVKTRTAAAMLGRVGAPPED